MNNKKILLFPGQGSQYAGMSRDLAEKFSANSQIKAVYECGSDILGYDLKALMYADDADSSAKLSDTLYAQPTIFAASLVSLFALQEAGVVGEVNACAGHSLGEYAALVCCGVLDVESGFKAIKVRSQIMSKAGKANPSGMAAVIGVGADIVSSVCDKVNLQGLYVTLANHNSPQQCVIAGELDALDKAEEILKALPDVKRLKVVRLKVSAAFHCKLMKEASQTFLEELTSLKLSFGDPKADFYSNLTAGKIEHISAEYLSTHMLSPVMFVPQLLKIHSKGYGVFIETGPGKVLSGLVSKTLEDVKVFNAEDSESLTKTTEGAKA